jgi:hypothetical protein
LNTRESKPGSPEKPLSDHGKIIYSCIVDLVKLKKIDPNAILYMGVMHTMNGL